MAIVTNDAADDCLLLPALSVTLRVWYFRRERLFTAEISDKYNYNQYSTITITIPFFPNVTELQ